MASTIISYARFLVLGCMALAGGSPENVLAETWSEPWHREVLLRSDSLAEVEFLRKRRDSIEVRVLGVLAGESLPERVRIASPAKVSLTSASGHREELSPWIDPGRRYFVLLARDGKVWRLQSPSSGADDVMPGGQVAATYRISFTKAVQSESEYRRLQSCVFNVVKKRPCDVEALSDLLVTPLHEPASGLGPDVSADEASRFFKQHAAMESSYLLRKPLQPKQMEPFLEHGFFHTQVSAVRALAVINDIHATERLESFVRDGSRTGVARSMAIVMLAERGEVETIKRLQLEVDDLADIDAESQLPIPSIMDPRIGTWFPGTVRDAIRSACGERMSCDPKLKQGSK